MTKNQGEIFDAEKIMPPVFQFVSNDFNSAWENAIRNVLMTGKQIVFGGPGEAKKAIDTVQTIVLNYNAVNQILAKQIHPKFPFKMVDQYTREFTQEFLDEHHEFAYLYYDRLTRDNQINNMRINLSEQMTSGTSSNRNQMTTWIPWIDQHISATPCLQRIKVRYEGDNTVSVIFDWRSRDLFGAWQVNLVGLIDMLQREVTEPNECKIARIIDRNDSLHIYNSDLQAAKQVMNDA